MEVRTLQKSVRRATLNGNGAKNLQKSLLVPSLDALFRPRARFWSIFGSRPGPKMASKPSPRRGHPIFGPPQIVFFAFSWHGRVPEGSRDRFKAPGDPPGQDFGRIFLKFYLKIWVDFHKHLQYFFALQPGNLILILYKIPFLQEKKTGMLPGSAPNLSNPPAGVPLGYGDSRSGLNKEPCIEDA